MDDATRVMCKRIWCGKTFDNTPQGHIEAYKAGWRHENEDGESWCREHAPGWMEDVKLRIKKGR